MPDMSVDVSLFLTGGKDKNNFKMRRFYSGILFD